MPTAEPVASLPQTPAPAEAPAAPAEEKKPEQPKVIFPEIDTISDHQDTAAQVKVPEIETAPTQAVSDPDASAKKQPTN